ncbi:MAG: phosphoribosyltransferase family protein, partial [Bacteroidales bacterium]|nr:phosphoribosyltransferase family protein [Bacteroidales bacterium]
RVLGAACAERLLRRCRRTRSQTHLHGEAKAANVVDAFALRSNQVPAAHHILLVDDVFTTGATLAACHRALRRAYGPQVRISVATLAAVGD